MTPFLLRARACFCAALGLAACSSPGVMSSPDGAADLSPAPMDIGTPSLPYGEYADIAGLGPDEVWVVGGASAIQWDGAAWTEHRLSSTPYALRGVWPAAHDDVWVVGNKRDLSEGNIYHFDGSNWTQVLSVPSATIAGIWGSGPRDLWAVGSHELSTPRTLCLHWDGASWTESSACGGTRGEDLWGSGPDDIWVVGSNTLSSGSKILHWDGTAWSPSDYHGGFTWAVWGSGPRDVWAAGFSLSHWDGTAWSPVSLPTDGQSLWFSALWGSGPDDVWLAGGASGTPSSIVTGTPPRGPSTLFHYDGSTWTRAMDMTRYSVSGLWGSGPGDLWTAGLGVEQGIPH